MESLYHETNGLLQQTHIDLGALEGMRNESDAQKIIQNIYQRLKQIDGNCERLDICVSKEPPHRRRTVKYKVDQLKFDCHSLHSTVDNMHMRMTSKWRAMAEREELLTQRFRPNDSTHVPIEDCELLLHDRLQSSHTAVDELISHGSAILEQIRSQGIGLKGIKRKVLDIGQTLGLSSTTLQMIERRVSEDWIIFGIGCVAFIISMYVFYRFWKG
uniref:Golgi SNAP receptor complex member 2 n=1 Tax=Elaeophora elaphi TaxID=1147741 RepID=A0A0R3RR08_9BILA